MTISEIRDLFVVQYKLQSQIRGIKNIEINNKLLASFISQAQQDIQRRLLVVEYYEDITLTDANEYDLPSDFGLHNHVYIGGVILKERPAKFIREQLALGNEGDWFGISQSGNTQKIIATHSSGTLRIYYYPDFNYYRPSLGASQDWGNFTGVTFSGKLMLPDRYDMAILYYMLAQVLPDYWNLYEKEIRSLRGSRVSSMDESFGYNLGGLDEIQITGTTPSITISTPSPSPISSNADKYLRIRASDDTTYSIEESDGWTTAPTIVNNTDEIIITSPDSEFTNYIHVMPNNLSFGWTQTGATTITITPYPGAGWGDAEIIVECWL